MFRYGATTLQANTWYHVTGVYDAATSELARVSQRPARRRHAGRHGHVDTAELVCQRQHRPAPDGQQLQLQRSHRRRPHLQQGTDAGRDPGGHEHPGRRQAPATRQPPTAPTNLAGDRGELDARSTSPGRPRPTTSRVTGYRVERCQGAGCSSFAEIAQPTGHDVLGHRAKPLDELLLPRARRRRRAQPRPLLGDRERDDAGSPLPLRTFICGVAHGHRARLLSTSVGVIFSTMTRAPTAKNSVFRNCAYSLLIADASGGSTFGGCSRSRVLSPLSPLRHPSERASQPKL